MADTKDFSSALEEMKQKAPDIYDSFIRWYGPGDLQDLASNESIFNEFSAQFNAELEKQGEAEEIIESAVLDEVGAPAETDGGEGEEGDSETIDAAEAENVDDADTAPQEEIEETTAETEETAEEEIVAESEENAEQGAEEEIAEDAEENAEEATAEEETPVFDEKIEAMASDPFQWEDFYAPAPAVETARFNEAYNLLNSDEGKEYQEKAVWKNNDISFDNSEDKSLNEALNLSACRRLASSDQEISLDNISSARQEERARIETEYYNSLYAMAVGNKYTTIKAETHLERILKIDEAVRAGKSEKEIFKMLAINPNDSSKKLALNVAIRSNMKPISDFVEKRSKFSRGMHGLGKVMDSIQKFEAKNPMFGVGVNFIAAGNPIYMGYRSILSARAMYNDFQGFKDYATFKEVFKNNVSEQGLKLFAAQNPESRVTLHDYNQAKAYKNYNDYAQKHSSDSRLSQEEFLQLKKFQKTTEFTREDFESLRQYAGMPYEEYAKRAGNKAVSQEMFNNVVKYTDIRRTQNYAEYAKKAGDRAVSEKEYAQVKTLAQSLGKVSMSKALKDKKTLKDLMAHSVIFVRSLPVVGQTYALGMTVKNMVSKTYWKGLAAKAVGTGKSIQTLWNKKGRDKQAWKELYSNGSGLLAEVAGAYMLGQGVQGTVQYGTHFVEGMQESGHSLSEHAAIEAQHSIDRSVEQFKNTPTNVVDSISNSWSRLQGFMGFGNQEIVEATPENAPVENTRDQTENQNAKTEPVNTEQKANTETVHTQTREENTNTEAARPQTQVKEDTTNTGVVQTQTPNQQENTAAVDSAASRPTASQTTDYASVFNQFNPEGGWKGFGQEFTAAADSTTVDDIQIPLAAGEHQHQENTGTDQEPLVTPATATEFTPTDVQKQNLQDLFTVYPRAATIILEGNETPTVDNVTNGSFKLEGEGNLYKSGVISSATLQELYDSGKLSSSQVEALVKFADTHFKDGAMIGNDAAALNAEMTAKATTAENPAASSADSKSLGTRDIKTGEQNGAPEQTAVGGDREMTAGTVSTVKAYSFDEKGNVIYQMDAIKEMAGMNPDETDAMIYKDLQARLAEGQTLDGGALKFMEEYKTHHTEAVQQNSATVSAKQDTTNGDTSVVGSEQITETKGIALTRHDFESGKGYEMSGTTVQNGKNVEVLQLYGADGKMAMSQFSVVHDETHSTVIKTYLNEDGRRETLVTEIAGDEYKTTKAAHPSTALREAIGSTQQEMAEQTPPAGAGKGRPTEGLEESQKINLTEGDNKDGKNGGNHSASDDVYAAATPETVEHKVWSTTFKGKYWVETDANGDPQLQYRIADRQSLNVDRSLLETFQNTIRSNDGTSHNFSALGGALQADNYGAENRDNPGSSGIMVKCEYLAERISLNEAVYHDMDVRTAKGETLSDQDLQWRQNYEKDLSQLGLVREGGRLSYNPEAATHVASQTAVLQQGDEVQDQGESRRVYKLDEREHTANESEQTKEGVKAQEVVATEQGEYTHLEGKGAKIAYQLTENGQIKYESNATVTVDQNVLRAIRSQYDNPFLTAGESVASLKEANIITKNELVYDHLQALSSERELTKAEQTFMHLHDEQLAKNGLKHDTNGEIVKQNAYDGTARAAVRRSRGGHENG